jgi:fructokinase
MSQTELPIVVGLGELLWDCFAESRLPGGAPANVAFHACQMGCRGIVGSRVGRDSPGDELIKFLAGQGLETDWVQRDAEHPTSTVTVDTSQPNHPRFIIHENVAWDFLALDEPLRQLLKQASAVCFGTLAQRSPQSRQSIHAALAAVGPQCLIVYDVNLRQHFFDRQRVVESLSKARIVKLNAEEVIDLDKLLGLDSPTPLDFARLLQERFGVDTVCITRGDRGCLLVGPDEFVDDPGTPVRVADAVGAGDAFTAALILGRLGGWPLVAQASFANAAGALVASRPGAMPVLRDEFARLSAGY